MSGASEVRTKQHGLPATAWHSARRAELLQQPGVKELLRRGCGDCPLERFISLSLLVFVVALHSATALALQSLQSCWATAAAVLAVSATVGAQCAFLLQALNHECSHGVQRGGQGIFTFAFALGSAGASLCHVPWAAYYFGGGHPRHHRYAGSPRDVDGDALFWMWEAPRGGIVRRFCWISFASLAVPVFYNVSLAVYALRDIRANLKELSVVSLDLMLTVAAHACVGWVGAAYLFLSSCFSMGLFCHPLLAFWILQHYCARDAERNAQPTVSYGGSTLWNWLCLNELLHVEHHDLASVSWRHLPELHKLSPQHYSNIYTEMSIFQLIGRWLVTPEGDPSWDFACRAKWYRHLERVLWPAIEREAAARRRAEVERRLAEAAGGKPRLSAKRNPAPAARLQERS